MVDQLRYLHVNDNTELTRTILQNLNIIHEHLGLFSKLVLKLFFNSWIMNQEILELLVIDFEDILLSLNTIEISIVQDLSLLQ